MQQEVVLYGIAASPGIAVGRAKLMEDQALVVTKKRIPARRIPQEIKRFRKAIEATHKDLNHVEAAALKTLGKEHARLIDAHRMILEDPILTRDVIELIRSSESNAEYALSEILSRANAAFEAIQDEFFRERRHDLFDVGRRILRHLMQGRRLPSRSSKIAQHSVVIAKNLLPTDTIHLKEQKVLAFVTEEGGRTSHVAILAQSMAIPAVVGTAEALNHVANGDEVIVDGNDGVFIIRPTVAQLKYYKERAAAWQREQELLLAASQGPAITAEGTTPFSVAANLDTLEELPLLKKFGAEGIGLFRTELVAMEDMSSMLADTVRQSELYARIIKEAVPHPVIIRLLDIGADKLKPMGVDKTDTDKFASQQALPMDLRGIRLTLRYPSLLKNQIQAILRASVAGEVKILIPMVSALEEVREVRWLIKEVQQDLDRQGVAFRRDIPLGVMIEVPSVAVLADVFLKEVDFASVGTNDLVQYALACDRTSAELAYLYQEFHPAVLRLLRLVTEAAHRHKKWIGICGEMAGNPLALPLLLGLGFDGLSVTPHQIPRIKKNLRSISMSQAKEMLDRALNLSTHEEVVEFLKRELPGP